MWQELVAYMILKVDYFMEDVHQWLLVIRSTCYLQDWMQYASENQLWEMGILSPPTCGLSKDILLATVRYRIHESLA